MKKYFLATCPVLFLMFVILSGCCGDSENIKKEDFSGVNSVEDSKKLTDENIDKFMKRYTELCGKKRNDHLKGEFDRLAKEINYYEEGLKKAENLNYNEQEEAVKYLEDKMKSNDVLTSVKRYSPPCWSENDNKTESLEELENSLQELLDLGILSQEEFNDKSVKLKETFSQE